MRFRQGISVRERHATAGPGTWCFVRPLRHHPCDTSHKAWTKNPIMSQLAGDRWPPPPSMRVRPPGTRNRGPSHRPLMVVAFFALSHRFPSWQFFCQHAPDVRFKQRRLMKNVMFDETRRKIPFAFGFVVAPATSPKVQPMGHAPTGDGTCGRAYDKLNFIPFSRHRGNRA